MGLVYNGTEIDEVIMDGNNVYKKQNNSFVEYRVIRNNYYYNQKDYNNANKYKLIGSNIDSDFMSITDQEKLILSKDVLIHVSVRIKKFPISIIGSINILDYQIGNTSNCDYSKDNEFLTIKPLASEFSNLQYFSYSFDKIYDNEKSKYICYIKINTKRQNISNTYGYKSTSFDDNEINKSIGEYLTEYYHIDSTTEYCYMFEDPDGSFEPFNFEYNIIVKANINDYNAGIYPYINSDSTKGLLMSSDYYAGRFKGEKKYDYEGWKYNDIVVTERYDILGYIE